jgi:hypothetical protein
VKIYCDIFPILLAVYSDDNCTMYLLAAMLGGSRMKEDTHIHRSFTWLTFHLQRENMQY